MNKIKRNLAILAVAIIPTLTAIEAHAGSITLKAGNSGLHVFKFVTPKNEKLTDVHTNIKLGEWIAGSCQANTSIDAGVLRPVKTGDTVSLAKEDMQKINNPNNKLFTCATFTFSLENSPQIVNDTFKILINETDYVSTDPSVSEVVFK